MNAPSGKLHNLTSLSLRGCYLLHDVGLSSFLNLCSDKLTTLNVSHTKVSGVGLNVPSGKLSNLTNLDLEYCSELDDAGLSSFLNLCSDQLITLDVSGVYISEEFLANVQTSQPGLKIRIDFDLD